MVKDGLPPLAAAAGITINQSSPYTPLQIIGAVVGVIGVLATLWRCWEARRTVNETKRMNNFNIMKWEHENASNKASETTSKKEEANDSSKEEKAS